MFVVHYSFTQTSEVCITERKIKGKETQRTIS